MRVFFEITRRSAHRYLAYRAATFAGLLTNLFFGLLRMAVLVALYGQRTEMAGMSVQAAITYTAVSQACIAYLSLFGWYELMNSVYTGAIASDLLKPLGYFRFWLAQDLGRALVTFSLRGVFLLLIYSLFIPLTFPRHPLTWLLVFVEVILCWLLSFSWRYLVNLAAFWTPNALGIGRFASIMFWSLSGFLMPLRFYPDWFISLVRFTPFPYTVNALIEVYFELLDAPTLLATLLLQIGWIAALIIIGQFVLRRGVQRLVVLGG